MEALQFLVDHTSARDRLAPVDGDRSLLHIAAKYGKVRDFDIFLERSDPASSADVVVVDDGGGRRTADVVWSLTLHMAGCRRNANNNGMGTV